MKALLVALSIPALIAGEIWLAGYGGEVGAERLALWLVVGAVGVQMFKPKAKPKSRAKSPVSAGRTVGRDRPRPTPPGVSGPRK